MHFTPTVPGEYPILCTQVCGLGHGHMQARLRVVSQPEFDSWLATREQKRLAQEAIEKAVDEPRSRRRISAEAWRGQSAEARRGSSVEAWRQDLVEAWAIRPRKTPARKWSLGPGFVRGQIISRLGAGGRFASIFSTRHRTIGIQYLLLSLVAVAAGTGLSLVMRVHLVWPELAVPFFGQIKPEDYLALVTMHGTLMVFFVLTTAPLSGFANLVLPEQIGSRRMALPTLNALSFWMTALALLVLLAGFIVPGGAPISGWTSYPPLSAIASAGPGQGLGMDMWLASLAIFCIASWLGAVNILATVVGERCKGMTLMRMPLTVWSWLIASLLVLVVFSVLLAALVLLFSDRHFGTFFFIPIEDLVAGPYPFSRRRLAAALAAPLLVLRASGGLHRRSSRNGNHLVAAGKFQPKTRPWISDDGSDYRAHRPARPHCLGTSHVRQRDESVRGDRLRSDDDGHRSAEVPQRSLVGLERSGEAVCG